MERPEKLATYGTQDENVVYKIHKVTTFRVLTAIGQIRGMIKHMMYTI